MTFDDAPDVRRGIHAPRGTGGPVGRAVRSQDRARARGKADGDRQGSQRSRSKRLRLARTEKEEVRAFRLGSAGFVGRQPDPLVWRRKRPTKRQQEQQLLALARTRVGLEGLSRSQADDGKFFLSPFPAPVSEAKDDEEIDELWFETLNRTRAASQSKLRALEKDRTRSNNARVAREREAQFLVLQGMMRETAPWSRYANRPSVDLLSPREFEFSAGDGSGVEDMVVTDSLSEHVRYAVAKAQREREALQRSQEEEREAKKAAQALLHPETGRLLRSALQQGLASYDAPESVERHPLLNPKVQGYLPVHVLRGVAQRLRPGDVSEEALQAAQLRSDHNVRLSYAERGHAQGLEEVTAVYRSDGRLNKGYVHKTSSASPPGKAVVVSRSTWFSDAVYSVRDSAERTLAAFQVKFEAFTMGALRGADLSGVVVGGSAVLAALLPLPTLLHNELQDLRPHSRAQAKRHAIQHLPTRARRLVEEMVGQQTFGTAHLQPFYNSAKGHPFADADIDLFLVSSTLQDATRRARELAEQLTQRHEPGTYHFVRSSTAITIVFRRPLRNIQIVTMVYKTVGELLAFSDLDCTSFAYDGRNVYTSARGRYALNCGYNVLSLQRLYLCSSVGRVIKYAQRGFATVISGLPEERYGEEEAGGGATGAAQSDELLMLEEKIDRTARGSSYDDISTLVGRYGYSEFRTLPDQLDQKSKTLRAAGDLWFAHGPKLEDVMGPDALGSCPLEDASISQVRWKREYLLESRMGDLLKPRCYMCMERFSSPRAGLLVCNGCSEINQEWTKARADLRGKVALVTGGRIKIGFHVAAKLLRCGATVIVVTRFPQDAARRLKGLGAPGNCHIYGVDLRQLGAVMAFLEHVQRFYPRLDIIVNNAAQTVRRPAAYYRALFEEECALAAKGEGDGAVKLVGEDPFATPAPLALGAAAEEEEEEEEEEETGTGGMSWTLTNVPASGGEVGLAGVPSAAVGKMGALANTRNGRASLSAACSQLQLLPEDAEERNDQLFPPGKTDLHGEQLDLRPRTTWTAAPQDVDVREAMEVQVVNATVPLMIASALLPRLMAAGTPAYIVNVSSPEGQFSSAKSGEHAHTNMAKAGLNMLTRTLAAQCAHTNVHVTSVDTGWVSRMRPGPLRSWSTPPPLSEEDGAARVLHPVFEGERGTGVPLRDCLLRDFEVVPW